MTLALLQPVPAPNLYDLAVMFSADKIVLQDCEQWSRKGRVHRSKIRTPDGTQYVNIPVRTEDRDAKICDARIDHTSDWSGPILKSLRYNYRNSLYFDFYEPEIEADILSGRDHEYLLPFVLFLRSRLLGFLDLADEFGSKTVLASEWKEYDPDPDQLMKRLQADRLFQEHGSRHYQRQGDKRSEPDFDHPVYPQHFDGFEPWCSLYDILFQFGPESFRLLDRLKSGFDETS